MCAMAFSRDSDRYSYLQQLVTEFQDTNSKDSKHQVLANLANFAYDPSNYEYLRRLNVIDLFLDQLTDDDETLIEFAIGGLCNLSLDPENKGCILRRNGVSRIVRCLSSTNEETVLSAVTTLISLADPQAADEIVSIPVVECMLRFSHSTNRRLSNLSQVFLQDVCTADKIQKAKDFQKTKT